MAGEIRGRVCEALIVRALKEANLPSRYSGLSVVWDKPIPGLSIKPDVTLRDSNGALHLLIQVTYSGSETHEREKFWRDFAELADFRRLFSCPAVYATCLSPGRVRIGRATTATRNSSLSMDELPHGEQLVEIVSNTVKAIPATASQEAIIDALDRVLSTGTYDKGFEDLKSAVTLNISKQNEEIISFWDCVRTVAARNVPSTDRKKTYVRRGIALLTILPNEYRSHIYDHITRGVDLPPGPQYAESCSLIQNTGENAKLTSEAILNVVNLLEGETIEEIIAADKKPREHYIQEIRELDILQEQIVWIARQYSTVTDESRLSTLLHECFNRSLSWTDSVGHSRPNCWLYSSIRYILNSFLGPQGQGWMLDVVSETGRLRSLLVGMDFPQFERLETPLDPQIHDAVARALARRLRQVEREDIISKTPEIIDGARKHLLGNKLIANGIDPVGTNINLVLDGRVKSTRIPSSISTWLREEKNDQEFDTNVLATQGYVLNSTFINWKSAYEGDSGHKAKETFARASHIRTTWSNEKKTFQLRKDINKYILVIDGVWTESQIDYLYKAGWDHILYPDELPELPHMIV